MSYQAGRRVPCFASMIADEKPQAFILLTDALALMRKVDERGRPQPFALEVTTCDEQRDTGGDNLVLTNWVLASVASRPNNDRHVRRTEKPAQAKSRELADQYRLLRNPANDELRQVHIRLITVFNGQLILW